jgi:hypothetical protein
VRALAVEMHENWIEAICYLNMDYLREHKKDRMRRVMRSSELTNGNRAVPAAPPVEGSGNARTVLARKGSLRRAEERPCLLRSIPAGLIMRHSGSSGNTACAPIFIHHDLALPAVFQNLRYTSIFKPCQRRFK